MAKSNCFSDFKTAEFNTIEAAAVEAARVSGRTEPNNADYIRAVTTLLGKIRQDIDAAQSVVAPQQTAAPVSQVEKVEDVAEEGAQSETVTDKDRRAKRIVDAVENAKTDEEYASAMDEYYEASMEHKPHPIFASHFLENKGDKAFQKAFDAAEKRSDEKSLTLQASNVNPDNNGVALTKTDFKDGKEAALHIAENDKRPWLQLMMRKIAPHLEGVPVHVLQLGEYLPDSIPAAFQRSIMRKINANAKGVNHYDYQTGKSIVVLRGDIGADHETLAHELMHAATMKALANGDQRFDALAQKVRYALARGTVQFKASTEVRDAEKFFAEQFREVPEFVSYALTSPTFQEIMKRMAADGEWNESYRNPNDQSRVSRPTPEKVLVPQYPSYSMWDRFVDAILSLFGLPKAYKEKYDGALQAYNTAVETNKAANKVEYVPLAEKLGQLIDDLLAQSGNRADTNGLTDTATAKQTAPDASTVNASVFSSTPSDKELASMEADTGAPKPLVEKLKRTPMGRMVRTVMSSWRGSPWLLGTLTLDQIKDRFGEQFPKVSAAVDKWLYMGKRANMLMEAPDKLVQDWAALSRRNPEMTTKLDKLFVDSTMAAVWVNGDTEPSLDPRNKHLDFKDPAVAKRAAELRTAYVALSEDHKRVYNNVTKALGDQFRAKQEAILKHVVDMYADDMSTVASKDKLMDLARAGKAEQLEFMISTKGSMTTGERINAQRFLNALNATYVPVSKVPGPYFPLQRKGDYIVVQKSKGYADQEKALLDARKSLEDLLGTEVPEDADASAQLRKDISAARNEVASARDKLETAKGNASMYRVKFFENRIDAQDYAADNKDKDGLDTYVVVRQEFQQHTDGVPATFLNKLTAKLTSELPSATAKDVAASVRELIVKSLPDASSFKAEIRRMNVEGANHEDAMESFAKTSMKNAWTVSRLENVAELTDYLVAAHSSMDMDERIVGNELMKRYNNSMVYTPKNALLDGAVRLSYLTHLGFSVGYYFQNMLQPWMVSLPVMAGRHGLAASSKALADATSEVAKILRTQLNLRDSWDGVDMRMDLSKFSAEERKFLQQLTDDGRINITVRADLGETGSTSTNKVGHLLQRASEISSWPAHQIEVVNRVATALAAFRLEKAKPSTSFESALAYADKVVVQTHVDYSQENAPRFMNPNAIGGLGRLAFQFRRYQQAMVFLWGKTLKDALDKGGWNEDTKTLTYLTGVNFAMAGATGLPIAAPMGVVAWVVSKGMDDDDERDFRDTLNTAIRDTLGDTAGTFLQKGFPAAIGVDMSNRVGSGSILAPVFQMPNANTGKDYMGQMAMQVFGPTGGMVANWIDATMIFKDNPVAAVQRFMPTGIKGFIEAVNRENRGLMDRKGNVMIEAEEFGLIDAVATGLNLGQSTKVSKMYDTKTAINNADQGRNEVRSRLLREATRARIEGDTDAAVAVREKIADFNSRQPAAAIRPKDVIAFYKQTIQRKNDTVGGIRVTKRNEDIAEEFGVTQ